LVNTFGQQGVGVDQLVNWSTKLIQEVEVDEVDQVSRSQLINWSACESWRRSIAIDHTHSHDGGVQLRLIKSTGKVTRELTKVINDRIELVKCSQVGRRPRALFENFDRDAQPS
jgi:hypothetical protein